jgi:midasin (ATPase involved in ribosome maturation)
VADGHTPLLHLACDRGPTLVVLAAVSSKGCRAAPHAQVAVEDLVGRIMPGKDALTGLDTLRFQPGPLASALKAGAWLLLDELNLAPDEVLQVGLYHTLTTGT